MGHGRSTSAENLPVFANCSLSLLDNAAKRARASRCTHCLPAAVRGGTFQAHAGSSMIMWDIFQGTRRRNEPSTRSKDNLDRIPTQMLSVQATEDFSWISQSLLFNDIPLQRRPQHSNPSTLRLDRPASTSAVWVLIIHHFLTLITMLVFH